MELGEIGALIGSAAGFLGGGALVSGLLLRRFDRFEKKLDRREADRVEESVIQGETLAAVGRLCEANTEALRAVSSDEVCASELADFRAASGRMTGFLRAKSAQYLHASLRGSRLD